jgi:hypothetical protein
MKRTVFISSTFSDLKSERKVVWNLLEDFQVDIRGMEEFGARTEAPLETCLAEVDTSDIYIGIIALRLGSIDRKTGKSFTQLEYEQAYKNNKEILIYLIDLEKADIKPKNIDFGESHEKLVSFKKLLKKRHTVSYYESENDLSEKLRRDFQRLLNSKEDRDIVYDSYSESKEALKRFFLLPKDTSGTEVRLKVKVVDKPFPASKLICEAFNFEFGSTIGLSTQILEPEGFKDSGLEQLFINAKQADEIIDVSQGDILDIWVRLQFADLVEVQDRARFRRMIEYKQPFDYETISIAQDYLDKLTKFEEIVHEPDGKLILVFNRFFEEQDV